MKKTLKDNPTLLITFGFIYISILGYFSSSKFLNYFNIKATDYFTFEDFVLSIVREGDLFLWVIAHYSNELYEIFLVVETTERSWQKG